MHYFNSYLEFKKKMLTYMMAFVTTLDESLYK